MLSTILEIVKSTKTTRVIGKVVKSDDVINVKQTVSEKDFVRQKYLFD